MAGKEGSQLIIPSTHTQTASAKLLALRVSLLSENLMSPLPHDPDFLVAVVAFVAASFSPSC